MAFLVDKIDMWRFPKINKLLDYETFISNTLSFSSQDSFLSKIAREVTSYLKQI